VPCNVVNEKIVNEIYPVLKIVNEILSCFENGQLYFAADLNFLCLLSFYRCFKLNDKSVLKLNCDIQQ